MSWLDDLRGADSLPEHQRETVFFPANRFRINPDPARSRRGVYLAFAGDNWFLVHPDVAGFVPATQLCRADLYEGMQFNGRVFILPVPWWSGVKDPWNESLCEVIPVAQQHWISVTEDKSKQRFQAVIEPQQEPLPKPWPTGDFFETVILAFRKRLIFTELDLILQLSPEPTQQWASEYRQLRKQMDVMLGKAYAIQPSLQNTGAPRRKRVA